MEQINLVQPKGGQGTSVTACAVAVTAAAKGRRVRLDGHDRTTLAAILGAYGDGPVSASLVLGTESGERFDLVVNDGPADRGTTLLVTRPCYLALRAAMNLEVTADAAGVVVVSTAAVEWLKANFFRTELELGHCLRLPAEGPCECDLYLSCAKFITTPAYAPRLRQRHVTELTLAAEAAEHGWSREVERHAATARRIASLLDDLHEPLICPDDSRSTDHGTEVCGGK